MCTSALRWGALAALVMQLAPIGWEGARPTRSDAVAQDPPAALVMRVGSDASLLDRPARLHVEEVPLEVALSELRSTAEIPLAFSPSMIPADLHVSCDCRATSVRRALDHLLADTRLSYALVRDQVLIEPLPPVRASRFAASARALPAGLAALEVGFVPAAADAPVRNGTVTGTVTDADTRRPLAGAQVFAPGTGFGSLTNQAGRFLIPNVPPGEVVLRVDMIGYTSGEERITVTSGETAVVDFALSVTALALEEVVVTGTAGQARRREIGNSITQIDTRDIIEPVTSVDNLLQGQAPGVLITKSSGMAGGGAQIRLRGNVSVAMSNQPLIYVDGVRVRSDGYPINRPPTGNTGRSGNDAPSPLNDINPADIDRIEIIKGAAATTLYGTEAAAGVIQIFTKRGHVGTPQWNLQVDQGFNRVLPFGTDENPYLNLEPWLKNAWRQSYSLSVRGGQPRVRYFVSGRFDDNAGVLPNDWEESVGIRGNVSFEPMDNLEIDWNTSYTNKDIQNTPAGNNAQGLTLNVYRAERNYFGSNDPELVNQLLTFELFTYIDRFITGVSATYTPFERFTNRVTVGYDRAASDMRNFRPYGFPPQPNGILGSNAWTSTTLTLDYAGSYAIPLPGELRSTFSWGAQSVTSNESNISAYGEDFPGPGEPTVSSAGLTRGFEERLRIVNAGFFFQNVFDFKDRYFLTLGARFDGNSAFGENLGLQTYPKAAFSYVLSEEPFWNPAWGSVKLRTAWGQAGRAPGAFDKVRTWLPEGWGNQPAFRPENVGNPDLGPERTTELELGVDAVLLGDRLATEFTYYRQKVTDALFEVRQVPSGGFQQSQLANVGSLRNEGIELSLLATLLRRPSLTWDVGFTVATNQSEILDLGGVPGFSLGNLGWILEGEPLPVVRGECIRNPDERAEPVTEQNCVYGPNQPTHTFGLRTALQLPRGISVSARGEYQGGHYINDGAAYNALSRGVIWPTCSDAYALMEAGRTDDLTAYQRSTCITANVRAGYLTYPADFFKLREVSAQIPLPVPLPGGGSASLTLSAHDAWKWLNDEFPIFDPEIMPDTGMDGQVRRILEHVPPPATYTASVKVIF